jgi:phage major head subunit gpT-like protein
MNTYRLYNDLPKLQYNLSQRQLFVDEYGYYIINKDISNVKDDNQEDFADQLLKKIIIIPLKEETLFRW